VFPKNHPVRLHATKKLAATDLTVVIIGSSPFSLQKPDSTEPSATGPYSAAAILTSDPSCSKNGDCGNFSSPDGRAAP
jgi:hypothetical protein